MLKPTRSDENRSDENRSDKNRYKRELQRVKFCFGKEKHEKLLKEMNENNRNIADLVDHVRSMEPIKTRFSPSARTYSRIQDHARGLYSILKRGFTQSCGCSIPHHANLRLETRSSPSPSSNPSFNVLFSFEIESDTAQTLPWNWRETRIEPINDTDDQDASDECSSIIAHTSTSAISKADGSPKVTMSLLVSAGLSSAAVGGYGSTLSRFVAATNRETRL